MHPASAALLHYPLRPDSWLHVAYIYLFAPSSVTGLEWLLADVAHSGADNPATRSVAQMLQVLTICRGVADETSPVCQAAESSPAEATDGAAAGASAHHYSH